MRFGFVLKLTSLTAGVILMAGVIIGGASDTSGSTYIPTFDQTCSADIDIVELISRAGGNPTALKPAQHSQLGITFKYEDTTSPVEEMLLPPRIVAIRHNSRAPWVLPGYRISGGFFQLACVPKPPLLQNSPPPLFLGYDISTLQNGKESLEGTWSIVGPRTLRRVGGPQVILVPDGNILEDTRGFFLPGDVVEVETFVLHYHPQNFGPPRPPNP